MTETHAASPQAPTQGLHHVAYGTKCTRATYEFYHEKLGMPLVHTELHRVKKGYFRHFFFDMGMGQHLAFFEIHDVGERPDYRTEPSMGLGMPLWVNHLSFRVPDRAAYDVILDRCKAKGLMVAGEVDHDFCQSFYVVDPNMFMIEFTYDTDTSLFAQGGYDEAYRKLFDVPAEDIGEDVHKGRSNPKVKVYG